MSHLLSNSYEPSIVGDIRRSDASSTFEMEIYGSCYAMKVVSFYKHFTMMTLTTGFQETVDLGFIVSDHDLNRHRCELEAYQNLDSFGISERDHMLRYCGHVDQLDPIKLQPSHDYFIDD